MSSRSYQSSRLIVDRKKNSRLFCVSTRFTRRGNFGIRRRIASAAEELCVFFSFQSGRVQKLSRLAADHARLERVSGRFSVSLRRTAHPVRFLASFPATYTLFSSNFYSRPMLHTHAHTHPLEFSIVDDARRASRRPHVRACLPTYLPPPPPGVKSRRS